MKLKKLFIFAVSFITVLLVSIPFCYAENINIDYSVNKIVIDGVDKTPSGDKRPFVYNGNTFVPLRYIVENLGLPVRWDGNTGTIFIGDVVQEEINQNTNKNNSQGVVFDDFSNPLSVNWDVSDAGKWTIEPGKGAIATYPALCNQAYLPLLNKYKIPSSFTIEIETILYENKQNMAGIFLAKRGGPSVRIEPKVLYAKGGGLDQSLKPTIKSGEINKLRIIKNSNNTIDVYFNGNYAFSGALKEDLVVNQVGIVSHRGYIKSFRFLPYAEQKINTESSQVTDTNKKLTLNSNSNTPPPITLDDLGFGGVKLGMSKLQVEKILGKPYQENQGESIGSFYKNNGKIFLLYRLKDNKETYLDQLRCEEGCNLRTPRNIGIGSTYEEVISAYGKTTDGIDASKYLYYINNNNFYLLSFRFENGYVNEIYTWGELHDYIPSNYMNDTKKNSNLFNITTALRENGSPKVNIQNKDLIVDCFEAKPLSDNSGWLVNMRVHNRNYSVGSIEVYDRNNNLLNFPPLLIPGAKAPKDAIDSVKQGVWDLVEVWNSEYGILDPRNEAGLYAREDYSFEVPKGGKIVISKKSDWACAYTLLDIGLQVLGKSLGKMDLSTEQKIALKAAYDVNKESIMGILKDADADPAGTLSKIIPITRDIIIKTGVEKFLTASLDEHFRNFLSTKTVLGYFDKGYNFINIAGALRNLTSKKDTTIIIDAPN